MKTIRIKSLIRRKEKLTVYNFETKLHHNYVAENIVVHNCDSKYGYAPGAAFTLTDIMEEVIRYYCRNVCITGGEPMWQPNIADLLALLEAGRFKTSIETGGSIDVRNYVGFKNVSFVVDVKCPSSKMEEKNYLDNLPVLRKQDQVKFVIADREDFDYMLMVLRNKRCQSTILISPKWGTTPEEKQELLRWFLEDPWFKKHSYEYPEKFKISIQIHKLFYGEDLTGRVENTLIEKNTVGINNDVIKELEQEGAIIIKNPNGKSQNNIGEFHSAL